MWEGHRVESQWRRETVSYRNRLCWHWDSSSLVFCVYQGHLHWGKVTRTSAQHSCPSSVNITSGWSSNSTHTYAFMARIRTALLWLFLWLITKMSVKHNARQWDSGCCCLVEWSCISGVTYVSMNHLSWVYEILSSNWSETCPQFLWNLLACQQS